MQPLQMYIGCLFIKKPSIWSNASANIEYIIGY